jgi:thiol:disulfide interchange protein DsbA
MQVRKLFKALTVSLMLAASVWMPAQAEAAKELNPVQPTLPPGQIEVIEFFSYGCPHCEHFDPLLSQWRAKQTKDVVFKRVPVSFGRAEWGALGRLYITLNALGLSDKLDPAVFEAIHKDRVKLDDEKVRNEWLGKKGVDVKKFNDTWRSFSVDTQYKRAEQMSVSYKVTSVPNLVIAGKYVVEGGDPAGLVVADGVIAKIRAGK